MAQETGSRTQYAYIAEVTAGTTPAGNTQLFDVRNFSANLNATVITDPTLRPNRMRKYSRRGNVSVEGSFETSFRPDQYDEFMQAALGGTWATDILKVGTTDRTYSIEQGFGILGQYRVLRGCRFVTMSQNLTVDGLVQMNFGFQGLNETPMSGTPIDATPAAVPAGDPFFHEGGTFEEGGIAFATFSTLQWELNNTPTTNYALGTTGARSITTGTSALTGSCEALFEDVALYNKFINNTTSSIRYVLTEGGYEYEFLFPRVKYLTGTIPVQNDGPLTVQMTWEALEDEVTGTTVQITRTAP
jgi:hypothetical protein